MFKNCQTIQDLETISGRKIEDLLRSTNQYYDNSVNTNDTEELLKAYCYWDIVVYMENAIVEAMAAAGYDYDDIDSYDECLVFRGNYAKMEFSSWNDALEWLEGVAFDDPEVSDNVEKILHPERF